MKWYVWTVIIALWFCYIQTFIDPSDLSLVIPGIYAYPAVVTVSFISLFFIRKKKQFFLFFLLVLLPFYYFFSVTFRPPFLDDGKEGGSERSFSLLSFNAHFFRPKQTYDNFSVEMINWVVEDTSDIQCIQEFCTANRWQPLAVELQMMQNGRQLAFQDVKLPHSKFRTGMAVVTNYDILNSRLYRLGDSSEHAIQIVDILIEQDTLRVFNVHLTSPQRNGIDDESGDAGFLGKLYQFTRVLFTTEVQRSAEIELLKSMIEKSPYEVIVAGDFNQLPYGFNYRKMRWPLKDAFLQKGEGLGITLNKNNLPLRIDYQWYSEKLSLRSFEVDYTMDYSDHYPLRATYKFEKAK